MIKTSLPLVTDEPVVALRRLFLWLTSGCNSRCIMCDIWKEKLGTGLSLDQIRAWAADWRGLGVPIVILCGEPLLHSDVWEMCQIIRDEGIAVELLSNGYLVPKHAASLLEHCEVWRASLDGPQEIHDATRGVRNAFGMLRNGIATVRALDPSYEISGRCAIHRKNFRHLPETVRAARDLGLSSISFSGTDLFNEEAFQRHDRIDGDYVEALGIAGDDLGVLEDELARMRAECGEEFASGYISDTPEDLDRNVLRYYRALAGQVPFPDRPCNSPWTSAIVEYSGAVRPCFPLDAYGVVGRDGSLSDVLNSPAAVRMRAELDVKNDAACQRCVCQTAFYG